MLQISFSSENVALGADLTSNRQAKKKKNTSQETFLPLNKEETVRPLKIVFFLRILLLVSSRVVCFTVQPAVEIRNDKKQQAEKKPKSKITTTTTTGFFAIPTAYLHQLKIGCVAIPLF